jgi:hypothetical protein
VGEKQEKVWVVSRYSINEHGVGDNIPFKVFDDRKDAREFVARMNKRSQRIGYLFHRALRA